MNPKDETVYEMKAQVSTVIQEEEYKASTNVRSYVHLASLDVHYSIR